MALRVLLADESSTIKKVMQLALQDFAVEVKSVPSGTDVLPVTKSFKPDIVFADVLLGKKNGYDVSIELKGNADTRHIPIILMWSGFMELDKEKTRQSMANATLEKPFDAENLRNIILKHCPKTQTNPVSDFLDFPIMPDFVDDTPLNIPELNESDKVIPPSTAVSPLAGCGQAFNQNRVDHSKSPEEPIIRFDEIFHSEIVKKSEINNVVNSTLASSASTSTPASVMPTSVHHTQSTNDNKLNVANHVSQHFNPISTVDDEEEEFAQVPLNFKSASPLNDRIQQARQIDQWTQNQANQIPTHHHTQKNQDLNIAEQDLYEVTDRELGQARVSSEGHFDEITFVPTKGNSGKNSVDISPELVEKVIREQTREIIETICWKVIPEIAEKIVREEIDKILRDTDNSI